MTSAILAEAELKRDHEKRRQGNPAALFIRTKAGWLEWVRN
jgi:hypothetical protein